MENRRPIRRITTPVQNTLSRRAQARVPVFTIGTLIHLSEGNYYYYDPAYLETANLMCAIPQELYEALMAASEEVTPSNWEEIELSVGFKGRWLATGVINRLIAQGIVSAAYLKHHAEAVISDTTESRYDHEQSDFC